MRLIGLILVLVVVAGVYSWGGNSLDEKQVRDFYEVGQQAYLVQDGEQVCALLAEDFEQVALVRMESRQRREVTDKQTWCQENERLMEQVRQLRAALGRNAPFEYSQTIISISIAPDKHSAQVELRSTLQLPGMRMTARSRETVIRHRWKTLLQRSEGTVLVGPAYR
jgi:hypothetical protein